MLRLRLVKDSRIIQIGGKILIASMSAIVGATNSQGMVRSHRPRFGSTERESAREAIRLIAASSGWVIVVIAVPGVWGLSGPPVRRGCCCVGLTWRYSAETRLPCSPKTLD